MKTQYMAIDQYGTTLHGLEKPRRDILAKTGYKKASKMYVDKKDGRTMHVGYIVGPHWFTVYEIRPMEKEDK